VALARLPAVWLYAPALVADNRAIGREVALTGRARAAAAAAYGPLLPIVRDARVPVPRLSDIARETRAGTRYVLCVLRPSRDLRLDVAELSRAVRSLGGGRVIELPDGDYAAVAGIAGELPELVTASAVPFRRELRLRGVAVEIRMEAWLASDTIRRMDFCAVVAGRRHTLIHERGTNFAQVAACGK